MFTDISLQRESNCPVHFVWDGNGLGRPVVRLGFLLLLVAGTTLSAGLMLASKATSSAGMSVAVVGIVVWSLGQVLTRFSQWRGRQLKRAASPSRVA